MANESRPKCVLCDKEAVTTAVQVLVCQDHYQAYADEAARYLPIHQRPVYTSIIVAKATRR